MPRRRRFSRASLSSEQSTSSDQSDSLNISDELPDPGLPKNTAKDVKEKKRVSFNFPVEVITKDGKYSGMGIINLMESSSSTQGASAKPRKTKGDVKNIVYDLTKAEKNKESSKNEEPPKIAKLSKIQVAQKNEPPITQDPPKNDQVTAVELKRSKKDAAKEAREAKKKETEARKEAIKKQVEEERQAKAELDEINKIFRPGECLKHMNIEIHPALGAMWWMEDLKREAAALGVRLVLAEDICDPGLLMWTRYVPPTLAAEGGQVKLSSSKKQCEHALYIAIAEDLLPILGEERVREHLVHKQELIGAHLILVLIGLNDIVHVMSRSGTLRTERFANAYRQIQMELMPERMISVAAARTSAELAQLVMHYTRAIAEAPYKKAKRDIDEQAEFFMRGDNKNCVTVDKDGNGLTRLWEQMIAILPMSSLEVARSLAGEYKTPSALTQELQAKDGMAKVANVGVTRANVPGAKTRRLGKEFARKLHVLFTSEDGNAVIE